MFKKITVLLIALLSLQQVSAQDKENRKTINIKNTIVLVLVLFNTKYEISI